jgi:hypothetical protein
MNSLSVLIICFTDLKKDPRVFRQLLFLKHHPTLSFSITAAGFADPCMEGVSFIQLPPFRPKTWVEKAVQGLNLLLFPADVSYWKMTHIREAYSRLQSTQADLIIANDIETVPLAVKLAPKHGVVLDAHEYTPRQFDGQWTFRLFWRPFWDAICKKYLPKVKAMMTVCEGIAEAYTHEYKVPCGVLTNAPFYEELSPKPVDKNHIKLVHHGLLKKARDLENMIELMSYLDSRFTLDLILVPSDPGYEKTMRDLASKQPRIRFIDPVPMPKIASFLNQSYDMGLCLFPPVSSNYRLILPNKFFECIQARLAIAAWPSQELVRMLKHFPAAVISENFSLQSLAEALNALTSEDIMALKAHAHQAAKQWCADHNKTIFLEAVSKAVAL